jgi:hypothetical protein
MGWFTDSKLRDDGDTIHESTYSNSTDGDSKGIRYSRDMDSDGNLTGRHLVDQDTNEKKNLPNCKIEDDDMF